MFGKYRRLRDRMTKLSHEEVRLMALYKLLDLYECRAHPGDGPWLRTWRMLCKLMWAALRDAGAKPLLVVVAAMIKGPNGPMSAMSIERDPSVSDNLDVKKWLCDSYDSASKGGGSINL